MVEALSSSADPFGDTWRRVIGENVSSGNAIVIASGDGVTTVASMPPRVSPPPT